MNQPNLSNNRKDYYRRSKNVKELLKGRKKKIYVEKFEEIVPAHEERKEDEVVILSPQIELFNPNQFRDARNFSKRGEFIKLETHRPDGTPRGFTEALIHALDETPSNLENLNKSRFSGYMWTDPERYDHFLHETTIIQSNIFHLFPFHSPSIQNQIKLGKLYSASDSHLRNRRVLVPTKRGAKDIEVIVEHLTGARDPRRFEEWPRIRTRHECPKKREDFSFNSENYVTYDHHDGIAILRAAREIGETDGRIPMVPIPLATEPMIRLYIGLAYHTLKLDLNLERETGRTGLRSLSTPEIDPVLVHTALNYGHKATHWVSSPTRAYQDDGGTLTYGKRMRDFDISIDSGGIPFKHKKSV